MTATKTANRDNFVQCFVNSEHQIH